jgi:hypothetical protein
VKRAPLLRVFVPSTDGNWLSDKSVLECEAELVWSNSQNSLFLQDLDYKYSSVGDLPQYLPTLAFPPSYFHRVIRTGPASTNPVVHIDLAPWRQEFAESPPISSSCKTASKQKRTFSTPQSDTP